MDARWVASDALAILVFAAVGQLSHHGGVSLAGFARDALPVLGCWSAAAWAFGLYRRPTLPAFLRTWLVGVTVGVAVRAAILGRAIGGRELAFLVTSLVFVLVFVLAFRAVGRVALRRRRRAVAG
jgi:hypothetical protein